MKKEMLVREQELQEKLKRLKRRTYWQIGIWITVIPLYLWAQNWAAAILSLVIITLLLSNQFTEKTYLYTQNLLDLMLDMIKEVEPTIKEKK